MKRQVGIVVIFVFLLVLGSIQVESAVINFDDLTISDVADIPESYAGFTWQNWYGASDVSGSRWSTYLNSYGSPSGEWAVSNEYGGQVRLCGSADFNFVGASFTSWGYNNSYFWGSATALRIEGYNSGEFVGQASMSLRPTGYDWLEVNLLGVDELRFIASGGSYNTSYFLMDDFTYSQASAVPDPPTAWLLGSGLVGFVGLRRRFFGK